MCGMIQAFCGLGFGQMLVVLGIFGVAIFGILVLAYQFVWSRGYNVGKKYATEQAERRALIATQKNIAGMIANQLQGKLGTFVIVAVNHNQFGSQLLVNHQGNVIHFVEVSSRLNDHKIHVVLNGQKWPIVVGGPNDTILVDWIDRVGEMIENELVGID